MIALVLGVGVFGLRVFQGSWEPPRGKRGHSGHSTPHPCAWRRLSHPHTACPTLSVPSSSVYWFSAHIGTRAYY